VDKAQTVQDFHGRFGGHGEAHFLGLARDGVYRMDANIEVRGDSVEPQVVSQNHEITTTMP